MTRLEEWKNDFKGFIDELSMPKDDYNGIMEYIDEVPNEERWIPVSEGLPLLKGSHKISDDVLITNGFENDMGYLVERKGKIFWHYYGGECEVGIKDEDNDAIAWMPLPEPYKVDKEESHGRTN